MKSEVGLSKFEGRSGISGLSEWKLPDSSPGTREFDKICVLIYCVSNADSSNSVCECWVYCIDANSSSSGCVQSLQPAILWNLDYLCFDDYVILGSKLYMFGGRDEKSFWGFYDIKTALSSPNKPTYLRKESLQEGPPMKASKNKTVAVVIADSKICVFGRVLHLRGSTFFGPPNVLRPSFELLDTRRGRLKWKSLPELFKNYDNYRNVSIESYCVHHSCLIVNTYKQGIYGIDVDNPRPKWVTLDPCGKNGFPFQGMFAMVDKVMFDPCPYPLTTIQPLTDRRKYGICRRRPLGALCFDHRCKNLCRVQAVFPNAGTGFRFPRNYDDDNPRLLVDFVKFDHVGLDMLGSDLSDWENIQSDKSLTFTLTYCRCDYMHSMAICPIKTREIDESIEEEDIRKKKKKMAEKQGRRPRQKIFQGHLLRRTSLMKKKREILKS